MRRQYLRHAQVDHDTRTCGAYVLVLMLSMSREPLRILLVSNSTNPRHAPPDGYFSTVQYMYTVRYTCGRSIHTSGYSTSTYS